MSPGAALSLQFYHSFACQSPGETSADDPPLFLATDGVHGVVNIDYGSASSASYSDDIIKLCLSGKLLIRMPAREKGSTGTPIFSVYRKSLLNMVDVLPVSTAYASTSSVTQLNVKFDLNLPKSMSSYTEDSGDFNPGILDYSKEWNHLPSSLSVRSSGRSDPYCPVQQYEAKVLFTLQAYLLRNGEIIGSILREVRIFDGMGLRPPTFLSDFPTEYVCEQKVTLRKHVFARVGAFSAAVAEPDPFLFCDKENFAMTRLPICFAAQGSNVEGGGDTTSLVATFSANITWQLKSRTFMSIEPMNFVPTVLQARSTPAITMATTLGLRHQLKLTLRGWKRAQSRSIFSNMKGIENAWIIEQELALSIPTRCMLAPTFVAPNLSRRYSLIVHIKVAGHGRASVWLEVPVQIVYQKEAIRRGGIHDESLNTSGFSDSRDQSMRFLVTNAVAELPLYVP